MCEGHTPWVQSRCERDDTSVREVQEEHEDGLRRLRRGGAGWGVGPGGGGGAVRRGWGGGGRGSAVVEGGVLPEDTDDGNHVELPPAQRREIADVDVCVCVCVTLCVCVCVCVCVAHTLCSVRAGRVRR